MELFWLWTSDFFKRKFKIVIPHEVSNTFAKVSADIPQKSLEMSTDK